MVRAACVPRCASDSSHEAHSNLESGMGTTFARRELYDLVWPKPIMKLAQDLGISGVAVARMCKHHRGPAPPRGYWARRESGQRPAKPPFMELRDRRLDRIEFVGGGLSVPEAVRAVAEHLKVDRKARSVREPVQPSIATPQALHTSVVRTAAALRVVPRAGSIRTKSTGTSTNHTFGQGERSLKVTAPVFLQTCVA